MFAASKTSKAASGVVPDQYFDYVTALLNTTGTNGAQNNTFIDSSTNNFTITRNGNTTQGSFSPFGENWSNYFDGSGDSLNTPASANFAFGTGDFTAEFWVNFTSISGRQDLVWWGVSASDRGGVIYNELAGNLTYYISPTVGRAINYAWTPSINTWYHIALVRSSGSSKLYLNGAQVSSTYADSKDYASSSSLITVAKDSSAASSFLFGSVSNLRIIKGTALYTANFTPSTTPLQPVSGTSLLTCQSPAIVDDSPNQFTITRAGDVSVQKFGPFAGTTLTTPYYAAYFDGTGDYLTVPSNAALNITSGSTDSFICEAWVYFSTVGPNMSIIDNGGLNTVSFSNWLIYLNASSQISIGWGNSAAPGSSIGILPSSTVPVVGQWYHLALVKTSSDWSLFINGTRATTFNGLNTASKSNSTALYIGFGINSGAGGTGFAGSISNVRIYNGATASAPYSATSTTITVPTAPLTAISGTSLLTCQSSTFIDNSTNNFAITAVGNARPITATPFTVTYSSLQPYTPAVFGGSGYFDGNGDYLTLPGNAAFNLSSGSWTVECWFYQTSSKQVQLVSSGASRWRFDVTTAQQVSWLFNSSSQQLSNNTAPLNQWNHVAMCYNGTTCVMYLNGIAQTQTGSLVPASDNTSTLYIGRNPDAGSGWDFNGYISGVRIVKGTALYTSSFVPQNAPPTAVTNTSLLLNATNAGIYDAATLNDFETVGNAQVSTSVKKYGTSSMAFDGSGDYLQAPAVITSSLGSADFTIEFWLYLPALPNTRAQILYWNANTSGYAAVALQVCSSNRLGLSFSESGSAWKVDDTTGVGSTLTAATWQYVTLVRNGQNMQIYLNGVAQGSAYTTTAATTSLMKTYTLNQIGVYNTSSFPLNGYLQDLRITRGIARYTTTFTPPAAALPTF